MEELGKLPPEQERELRELIIKLRTYQAQAETLSQQLSLLQSTMEEYDRAIIAINHCKELSEGTDLLVPVGAGSYVRARLGKMDHIIVGIGANVSAEKTPDDAVETLTKRQNELKESAEKISQTFVEIEQETQKLQSQMLKYQR